MTSAHEARNKLDGIRLFDRTRSADDIRRQALVVWVALASHATYLDGTQDHNINATTDAVENFLEDDNATAACVIFMPICFIALLFVDIFDHFNDATDKTSDNGVYTGTPGLNAPQNSLQDPQFIVPIIETTPLSTECNIYISTVAEYGDAKHTLAQRSFPGKWGGHNGLIDKSGQFDNKTSRFYELLLNNGDV